MEHDNELTPAGEAPNMAFGHVLANTALALGAQKQLQHLAGDARTRITAEEAMRGFRT